MIFLFFGLNLFSVLCQNNDFDNDHSYYRFDELYSRQAENCLKETAFRQLNLRECFLDSIELSKIMAKIATINFQDEKLLQKTLDGYFSQENDPHYREHKNKFFQRFYFSELPSNLQQQFKNILPKFEISHSDLPVIQDQKTKFYQQLFINYIQYQGQKLPQIINLDLLNLFRSIAGDNLNQQQDLASFLKSFFEKIKKDESNIYFNWIINQQLEIIDQYKDSVDFFSYTPEASKLQFQITTFLLFNHHLDEYYKKLGQFGIQDKTYRDINGELTKFNHNQEITVSINTLIDNNTNLSTNSSEQQKCLEMAQKFLKTKLWEQPPFPKESFQFRSNSLDLSDLKDLLSVKQEPDQHKKELIERLVQRIESKINQIRNYYQNEIQKLDAILANFTAFCFRVRCVSEHDREIISDISQKKKFILQVLAQAFLKYSELSDSLKTMQDAIVKDLQYLENKLDFRKKSIDYSYSDPLKQKSLVFLSSSDVIKRKFSSLEDIFAKITLKNIAINTDFTNKLAQVYQYRQEIENKIRLVENQCPTISLKTAFQHFVQSYCQSILKFKQSYEGLQQQITSFQGQHQTLVKMYEDQKILNYQPYNELLLLLRSDLCVKDKQQRWQLSYQHLNQFIDQYQLQVENLLKECKVTWEEKKCHRHHDQHLNIQCVWQIQEDYLQKQFDCFQTDPKQHPKNDLEMFAGTKELDRFIISPLRLDVPSVRNDYCDDSDFKQRLYDSHNLFQIMQQIVQEINLRKRGMLSIIRDKIIAGLHPEINSRIKQLKKILEDLLKILELIFYANEQINHYEQQIITCRQCIDDYEQQIITCRQCIDDYEQQIITYQQLYDVLKQQLNDYIQTLPGGKIEKDDLKQRLFLLNEEKLKIFKNQQEQNKKDKQYEQHILEMIITDKKNLHKKSAVELQNKQNEQKELENKWEPIYQSYNDVIDDFNLFYKNNCYYNIHHHDPASNFESLKNIFIYKVS